MLRTLQTLYSRHSLHIHDFYVQEKLVAKDIALVAVSYSFVDNWIFRVYILPTSVVAKCLTLPNNGH